MSKFVITIFPDEKAAYEGTRALKELQDEGNLTLYGFSVIGKDSTGKVVVKEREDQGPVGTAVSGLTGGLLGLLAGPLGFAVGATSGLVIGSLSDIYDMGVGKDFVEKVARELTPEKAAVIAEVEETWGTPLDSRMEALGGIVLREWRVDVEDEQIQERARALENELEQLREELDQANEEDKARLQARIDEVNTKLQDLSQRAEARINRLQEEAEGKAQKLRDSAAKAKGDAKAKIENRITELRENYDRRTSKLRQAWELTKEALL